MNKNYYVVFIDYNKYTNKLKIFKMKDLPRGEYRRMYCDRFARDDMMAFILNHYNNTQNIKYLKQLERISSIILYFLLLYLKKKYFIVYLLLIKLLIIQNYQ